MIRDEIALLNRDLSLDVLRQITDDEISETIKNPHCSILSSDSPVTIAVRSKLRIKWIPDKINYEVFFGNCGAEEPNMAFTFLDVLNSIPEHCLEAVCNNVVLAGGFWRIRGMQKLFKVRVLALLDLFPKLKALGIKLKLGTRPLR